MARFAAASKALRGPFKRLVKKLEIALRKPVIRKLGGPGRRVAKHFDAQDSESAYQAAREAAVTRRAGPRPIPVATSAAVDRTSGRVVGVGHSGDNPPIRSELSRVLPTVSLEQWPVTNCAEVSAASAAIESGSRLEDLLILAVRTKEDVEFPPCNNCKTWLTGED